MRKIILITLLSILLIFFGIKALAQDTELPSPGITPDSPFYFLKAWKEAIQTLFTFGAENKAKQFLHLADVRLAEYQKMIEKGKTEIAQRTLDRYERQLNQALEKAEEAKGKDLTGLKEEISEKILKHQEVLENVLEKAPEEAKPGIEKAIEASQKGFEKAVEAMAEEKKTELEGKAEEIKERIEKELEEAESAVCVQVIAPAISPEGTCKEFPTPCDVPEGWEKVDKCSSVVYQPECAIGDERYYDCANGERILWCTCKEGKWDCIVSPETTCPEVELRYYTCPDGTKVVSGKCYVESGCVISMSPELQCLAPTPPVAKGGECQTAGEMKYYQCPVSSQVSQVPWCVCGPESGAVGAKNVWRCQHLPEVSCPKPTLTPTESSGYISCTKGGTKNHRCSDGTMVRWQCQCFTYGENRTSADYHYDCYLEPTKFCPVPAVSTSLTITEINIRLQAGANSPSIFWTTNAPVLSYIEHGLTASYGYRDDGGSGTSGTQFVVWSLIADGTSIESKLPPDTVYHFRIVAEDAEGNKFVSQDYTFTTNVE